MLSGPGMDEVVKLNFGASRILVLLLAEIIHKGTAMKGNGLLDRLNNRE